MKDKKYRYEWNKNENETSRRPNESAKKKRIARKCYGIHPHCSKCGKCHTNVLTCEIGHKTEEELEWDRIARIKASRKQMENGEDVWG